MFTLEGLDLRRLVLFLRETGDDPSFSHARTTRAIVWCYVILLFVTGDLVVNTHKVLLVQQALNGRSNLPFVLAETLNGLDVVAVNQGEFFWGSPILLYMWLLERLWFLSNRHVAVGIMRNPDSFFCHFLLLRGGRIEMI